MEVQIRDRRFRGLAEAITELGRITDFFEMRLKRHPLFMGLPLRFRRADLEKFAAQKALVAIRPEG